MKTLFSTILFCSVLIVNQLAAQKTVLKPDNSIQIADPEIHISRQNKLLDQIENGVIVINSNSTGFNGGRHETKVSNYFFYLTGIAETDYALMLSKNGQIRYAIFYPERDLVYKTFSGEPTDKQLLKSENRIDEVVDYAKLENELETLVKNKIPVYIDFNDDLLKENLFALAKKHGAEENIVRNVTPLIAEMRIKKDAHEIKMLQRAIDVTGEALLQVCRNCNAGLYEYEMEALIEYNFRKFGASMPGFTSIVGSGKNSTILHYEKNNKKMEPGEVLLMDIGAEYGGYTSDITRTIPVNGKFSAAQKEIYELVLKAQKAAIAEMKPGNYINSGHFKANSILVDGLVNLGLITDPEKEWQRKFYILYPASHYLGMNVHDVGDYGASMGEFMLNCANNSIKGRPLEKGMVLTIEPGLYFRANGLQQLYEFFGGEATKDEIDAFVKKVSPVYEKYKNIGIRIEDDVLITEAGSIVLSDNIPKEISAIEKLMK